MHPNDGGRREASRKRAFTLIEIITAIGLITVLVLLSLPAIQRARASSQRLDCANRLRQLGVAIQHYQANYGVYPSAQPVIGVFNTNVAGGGIVYSPLVHLLPELGESTLFNSINFVGGVSDVGVSLRLNETVCQARVGTFLCPADGAHRIRKLGTASFRVNVGARSFPWGHAEVGAFEPWQWLSARDFRDGVSHTIGISEKLIGRLHDGGVIPRQQWQFTVQAPFPQYSILSDSALEICSNAQPQNHRVRDDAGASWFRIGYVNTWYNHVGPPNANFLDCAFHPPFKFDLVGIGVFGAKSFHPGGVNVLLMDGSLRFVSDTIDLPTWRSLATRSSGETIESNAF
jgi:prepilin-type processing-associated H-X9-DG protein